MRPSEPASHPLQLSLRGGDNRSGISGTVARAVHAERLGFDQYWIGNDFLGTSGLVALPAIATATTRIGIGVGVVDPVTLHPGQLASFAAGMADLSRGRFRLGIGAGSQVFFDAAGLRPAPPVRRTREAVIAVRALTSGQRPSEVEGSGEGWSEHAALHGPAVSVPIYVGGLGPKMLAMAGEVADGALPLCLPPERYARAAALIDAGAQRAGRDLSAFDLPACIWCSVADDPVEGRRCLSEHIARYSGSLAPDALTEEGFDPAEFDHVQRLTLAEGVAAGAAAVTADMLRLGICGGPDEVLEHCARLIEAGARHISFGPPLGPDLGRALAALGERVFPALRKSL